MGCSASKPITIITNRTPENHYPITTTTTTSESSNSSSPNQTQTKTQKKSFSVTTPLIHHPPIKKGDTHHLVSLTSTTYGYASLLTPKNDTKPQKTTPNPNHLSLSPDSVINTWELMHGLDDDDFNPPNPSINLHRPISTSCRFHPNKNDFNYSSFSSTSTSSSTSTTPTKPLWQHLSEESLLSKMDPNVALTYRRALSSRQLSKTRSLGSTTSFSEQNDVVIYFTTLRGIRKTYEDCCAVRNILRGFGVRVDERDVSMDSELKRELETALCMFGTNATEKKAAAARLPHVFIKGRHVGGAEEVMRMHEEGELWGMLEGVRRVDKVMEECGVCGEARFVPCGKCRGSRKVFVVEERELRRCKICNENGLVRCPSCCV